MFYNIFYQGLEININVKKICYFTVKDYEGNRLLELHFNGTESPLSIYISKSDYIRFQDFVDELD